MPFNPQGKAQIEQVKINRGTSDDAVVSVDIALSMEDVAAGPIASALGADNVSDVENSLFRPLSEDAEQSARFLGLKTIDSSQSWEGKHRITLQGLRPVRAHRVGKITVKPRGKLRCDLDFSVSIEQPPAGYVEKLAGMLHGTVQVNLEHDAELFDSAKATIDDANRKLSKLERDAGLKPKKGKSPAARRPAAKKTKARRKAA